MVQNLSAGHADQAWPLVWAGPEWHQEVTRGTTRSLPTLETPRELPQTLEQSTSPAHTPPPLSLLPEPDTPAKAKKNKGNNCTATGKATLRETELTGWKSQESELPSPTWEQRIAPFRTSAGVIISSAQGFVLASYADKSLIYGHLIWKERVE